MVHGPCITGDDKFRRWRRVNHTKTAMRAVDQESTKMSEHPKHRMVI